MKKILYRTLIALTGLAVLAAVGAGLYLREPLFGALPSGERLDQIALSPNYVQGAFRNQINTPMKTTDQSEWSMWAETLFGNRGQPRPPSALPAVKTDLKALDPARDLVVWLGHSSYFVQLGGRRVLIDPVFSSSASPVPLTNTAFDGTSIYNVADMPPIDFLLISHDHYDHLDYPSVLALKPKVRQVVVGLGVGAHFKAWGYDMKRVHEADWYQTVGDGGDLQIHVTPARHFSGRTFTRNQSLWVGFVLSAGRRRLFYSGDSGYGPHFAQIGKRYGPFEWAALDTGQYDPRWANVHMNPEQAAQAAKDLRTRVLMPSHVGRFSLAPHDWDAPFKRVTAASQNAGYRLWSPEIGEPAYLDGREQNFSQWWNLAGSAE